MTSSQLPDQGRAELEVVMSSSASSAPRKRWSAVIQFKSCACAASRQSNWHSQAWFLSGKASSACLYRIARRISDGLLTCHGTPNVSEPANVPCPF